MQIGSESVAVRIEILGIGDNVIGSMANGIQILYKLPSGVDINEIVTMLDNIDNKKVLPYIILKDRPSDIIDTKKVKFVIDINRDYDKKYTEMIYAIDDEGIVIYCGDSFDDCLSKISPPLNEKNKKHSHEDWMRAVVR